MNNTAKMMGVAALAIVFGVILISEPALAGDDQTLKTLQKLQDELVILKKRLEIESIKKNIREMKSTRTIPVSEPASDREEKNDPKKPPASERFSAVLLSVFGVGDTLYAEVWIDGARHMVVQGDPLPKGYRVVKVSSQSLLVVRGTNAYRLWLQSEPDPEEIISSATTEDVEQREPTQTSSPSTDEHGGKDR